MARHKLITAIKLSRVNIVLPLLWFPVNKFKDYLYKQMAIIPLDSLLIKYLELSRIIQHLHNFL